MKHIVDHKIRNIAFFVNLGFIFFWTVFPTDETSVYMLVVVPALILLNVAALADVIGIFFRKKTNIVNMLIGLLLIAQMYWILY